MIMQITFTPIKHTNCNQVGNAKYNTKPQFKEGFDVVSFSARNFLAQSEDEIFATIIKSIKDEKNCLGIGSEAEVFQIEGTNYCIRLPYDNIAEDTELISYFSNFDLNVCDEDKVNHVVARLGNGATLMHKINGRPIINIGMNTVEAFNSMMRVSQLPQSAYCNLLRQISEAYQKDMMFDPYGTNVIADTQNLTAIDFYKKQSLYKDDLNPLGAIYDALVPVNNSPEKIEKAIIKKIYNAALLELSPNKKPCLPPEEFDFYNFTLYLLKHEKIDAKQFERIWKSFQKVSSCKELEMSGFNVNSSLKYSVAKTKKVLNEIF